MSAQRARARILRPAAFVRRKMPCCPTCTTYPHFVSAFRRADELAVAMEGRCYHRGEGRTRMKVR
jgi:energy-coupling factor transport system permease protein